jgi:hypothetical protein
MRPGSGAALSFYSVMTAAYRRAAVKGLGRSSAEHGVPGGGYRVRMATAALPGGPPVPSLRGGAPAEHLQRARRTRGPQRTGPSGTGRRPCCPRWRPRPGDRPGRGTSRSPPGTAQFPPRPLNCAHAYSVLLAYCVGRSAEAFALQNGGYGDHPTRRFTGRLSGRIAAPWALSSRKSWRVKWPPGTSGPARVPASSQSRLIASARLAERARPQRMRRGMRSALDLDSAWKRRKRERECRPARPGPHHDGAFVGLRDASDDR